MHYSILKENVQQKLDYPQTIHNTKATVLYEGHKQKTIDVYLIIFDSKSYQITLDTVTKKGFNIATSNFDYNPN